MKDFNPDALVAWIFCICCGYLIGGSTGAVAGLALITGLQLAAAFWAQRKKRLQTTKPKC